MKVGSLVECVNNNNIYICYIPDLYKIYTVREILLSSKGNPMIRLEEITNPIAPTGREFGYRINRFRELLPPMTISLDEILEKEITK